MASRAIELRRSLARRPRFSAPRPIVIRTTKIEKHHKKKHRGHGGGLDLAIALGGFALGMVDKSDIEIPELPYLGRAGTIGVIAYAADKYLHVGPWARKACLAAFVIAGYELGKEGKISGDEDGGLDGYVAGDF